ncbi:platelet binding protein GspB-like [Dermacentor albipictus]|uniref:platelet binding protein GspB-like n=1 Tax=Dermacentor albipictus TaxID=60249 RepID=UPI0038FCA503
MDAVSLVFQGDRPTKGTVLASVLVFALAAGTVVIAIFLLFAVFRDMSNVRTRRHLREIEPVVAKELPKALTVRRSETKSTLPDVNTRQPISRTSNLRKYASRNYSPVSAGVTSTASTSLKKLNGRPAHTSYTSIWNSKDRELSKTRLKHSVARYKFVSTYSSREERTTASDKLNKADAIAAPGAEEAPLPHEIPSPMTSVNKIPRSVRTVNQDPPPFPSSSIQARTVSSKEVHSYSTRIPAREDLQTAMGVTFTTMRTDNVSSSAEVSNYKQSKGAATTASSKDEANPIDTGSVPHENPNSSETASGKRRQTPEVTQATTSEAHGSTERDPLDNEEPFTEENDAAHIHGAFGFGISRATSSPPDRQHHSTHSSHVRHVKVSSLPTTGEVEDRMNGSHLSGIADTDASPTSHNGTSVQRRDDATTSTDEAESRTASEGKEDSANHPDHVFVGPGNWNDLAKDDEDAHAHGHIPIPDPDAAKVMTNSFTLDVFN